MNIDTSDYLQVRSLFESYPRAEILKMATKEQLRGMYKTTYFKPAPRSWDKKHLAWGIACILGTLHL